MRDRQQGERIQHLRENSGNTNFELCHWNRYTIPGSIVGTRLDLQEALMLAAQSKVKATIEIAPPDSVNEVFERLWNGKVQGRVVLGIAEEASAERFRRAP